MKDINRNLSVIMVLFFAIITGNITAQEEKNNSPLISTKPFQDGVNHWYNIRNKHSLVDPVENQQRYPETEYAKIADNILLFQRNNGGWPKNYDMRAILTPEQIANILETKDETNTTFDNTTTHPHIYYLAQVYTLTQNEKYKAGCLKGLDFVMEAQYENGGWPQYYPLQDNYSRHITFNDEAYIGIMTLISRAIKNDPNFAFLDNTYKKNLSTSYQKGLECILNMQIKTNDTLTVWCQQHNEIDLSPAWARSFEPPSICNKESAAVVLFLMEIENPNKRIINSIQSAVQWFTESRIYNTRTEIFNAPPMESEFRTVTRDRRVVEDPSAPPIWTRYYELKTKRPLFCDRDSKYRYSMAEVSRERRIGYAWYTNAPQKVLDAYPEWQQKWTPKSNMIKNKHKKRP